MLSHHPPAVAAACWHPRRALPAPWAWPAPAWPWAWPPWLAWHRHQLRVPCLLLPLLLPQGWHSLPPQEVPSPCAWAPCGRGRGEACAFSGAPAGPPCTSAVTSKHPFLPHMAAQAVRVTKERKASLGWGQRASRASMHAVCSRVGRRACRQQRRQWRRRRGVSSVWRRFQCSIGLDEALRYTTCPWTAAKAPQGQPKKSSSAAWGRASHQLDYSAPDRRVQAADHLQGYCRAVCRPHCKPHAAFPPSEPSTRALCLSLTS